MSTTDVALQASTLRRFFDAIAFRYDFLNSLLSFRLDELWRKWSVELVLEKSTAGSILDLGIGTGKFIQAFTDARQWKKLAGVDFSPQMLNAAKKILPSSIGLINADFQYLPFQKGSFDLVISAFTLRSVRQMPLFLQGIFEVLSEKGRAAFLCLTRPKNIFWRVFYFPYLKLYLPFIGGLISGNFRAYQFLADSILNFQEPEKTAEMMRRTGFRSVEIHRFSFGIATLIVGEK